ncbi:DUF4421 domain-containing protein [Hoylesella shahii]|uniref:DUF4421 domain-containing protein n=1 Tax=Hoylesella shahii TaxID=228603 RepID=UPI0028E619FF|nr:DUF4421 domain-containing protein [Hoylesella shahii]
MLKSFLTSLCFCLLCMVANAQCVDSSAVEQSVKPSLMKRVVNGVKQFVNSFGDVDTAYIEPQKYVYTVMAQNTYTYELYKIKTAEGNSVTFAPEPTIKLGPYVGWQWLFLGYTVDLRRLNGNNKQEFDLSFYTAQIGIDLFWRNTGNNYKISSVSLAKEIKPDAVLGSNFGGFDARIRGFNLYYILNHRRFSYRAAFSQSTVQRRSAGSLLFGVGCTWHRVNVDLMQLDQLITSKLGAQATIIGANDTVNFGKVKYTDLSVSGGYAYNWVFARNWVLAGSLSLALGYKRTTGDVRTRRTSLGDFLSYNVAVDGVGRFGIVWNNSRWYAGASTILHTYNYRKDRFSTNNMFGNLNLYVGFNFIKR